MNRRRGLRLVKDDYKDESRVIDIEENNEKNDNYLVEIDDHRNDKGSETQITTTTDNSLINPDTQGASIDELLEVFFQGEDPETLEQMKRLIQIFKQLEGPIRFIQQIQGPLRFIQKIQGPLRFIQQMQGPLQLARQLQGPLQMQQQIMHMQRPLNTPINPIANRQFQHHTQRRLQQQFSQQLEGILYQQMQGMIQRQIGQKIKQQLGKEMQNQLPNLLNNFLNRRSR